MKAIAALLGLLNVVVFICIFSDMRHDWVWYWALLNLVALTVTTLIAVDRLLEQNGTQRK